MVGLVRFTLVQAAILFLAVVAVSGLPQVGPDGIAPPLRRPFSADGGGFEAPPGSLVLDPAVSLLPERWSAPSEARRAWIRRADGAAGALLLAGDAALLSDDAVERLRSRTLAGVRERSRAALSARGGLELLVEVGRDRKGRWRLFAEGVSRRGVRVVATAGGEPEVDPDEFALPLLRSVSAPDLP